MKNTRWAVQNGGRPIYATLLAALFIPCSLLAAELSEAEKAWEEFQAASRQPPMPKEWRTKRPSQEEYQEYSKKVRETLVLGADKARDFYTKYPKDPNAQRAMRKEHEFLSKAVSMGDQSQSARLAAVEKARLADPNLDEDDRFDLLSQKLNREVRAKMAEDRAAAFAEYEKGARELLKLFPGRAEVYDMLLVAAQQKEGPQARELLDEILKAEKAGEKTKAQAAALVKKMESLGKPVDIAFEAVDGRKVDLKELKGKVVLIDFWATWCGPCVAELPNVLAAYEKLHDQGFEIVGISFDQSKEALTKFVAEKKMPWPQYFDGEGWANKYGKEFGINSIPAMWLVDKKGNLRDLNARAGLADKVRKLLDE